MSTRHLPADVRLVGPPTRHPTLADVYELVAFAGSHVTPTGADMSADVRALRPGGGDSAGEAEILLCDGPLPDPAPAGAVAVIARTEAPAGYPIPVIVLAPDASWTAVIDDLTGLFGAHRGRRAADRARAAFRIPLTDGRGFAGLSEACRDLLGAPVAVLDDYLDVLAEIDVDDLQTQQLDTAIADARARGAVTPLEPFVADAPAEITRMLVLGPGDRQVMVIATWLPAPLTLAQTAVLAEMAEACGIEWGRQEVRTQTESQLRGDLIRELMAGEAISRESLIRRARHLGADLAGGAVAMLGKLEDPHQRGPAETDERVARRFVQQARAVLDLHWPRGLVDWNGDRLLVLLPGPREHEVADRDDIEQRAHTLSGRLITATRDTVPGLVLTLAISRYTPEPERLGAALEEASLALSIGERIGSAGDVVTFEETGTYKLLFQIFADRPEELSAFYEQTIGPLVRYDEQYQTELVATLATYLEFDCNLAATAASLFTHRHTIRYRLDRIAELCGLDIGRTDDREKLSLGLKSMRLLGRKVPTPIAKEGGGRGSAP
jgi:sugar diacid utilization regulator